MVGVGVAVVLLVVGVVLWWRPWAGSWRATPSCEELSTASFTLVEAQPRGGNDSSATCVFAVASADRRVTGTARVFVYGSTDEQDTDRDVEIGYCPGEPEQVVSTAGPRSSRACAEVVGSKALASAYAATQDRFAAVNVEVTGPQEQMLAYAREVRAAVLDHALTTPAGK